jgi:hypothetical protein
MITWHSTRSCITPPPDPDGTGSVKIMVRDAAGDWISPVRLVNGKYYSRGGMVENIVAWAIMPISTAERRINQDGAIL